MFSPLVKYFIRKKGNFLINFSELIFYLHKRNGWLFDLSRFWNNFEDIKINRPVFLLGTEGAGLTLVSRMIRRDKNFVSVTGNCNYWSGADEIQLVLGSILPAEFTGIKHKRPLILKRKGLTANSIYAIDELLPYYRLTEDDVTLKLARGFRKIIRWRIARNALDSQKARFIDKSQVFTVKLSFINEILKDTYPKFILLTRNPYALCYRGSNGNAKNYARKLGVPSKEALRFACQHWLNSMKIALGDSSETEYFLIVRIEDILREPEKELRKICKFIEIDFSKDLLPQSRHKIPFGSKGAAKWYPLRTDVNEKYLNKIGKKEIDFIYQQLGEFAEKFGYFKPKCG